jgi:PKD domain/Secretion system C-terminal sorting domain
MKHFVIFFLFVAQIANAQFHDAIWHFTNAIVPSVHKVTYTTSFNQDSVSFDSIPTTVYFDRSAAFFSDSSGRLLFQTAGCFIADSNGDTITNGDEIGFGTSQYETFCGLIGTYSVWQYGFFLQTPAVANRYYFFYSAGENVINQIRYATIESDSDSTYAVIEKNQNLIQDSILIGGLMANKHANGRDWWIIAMKEKTNRIYTFLLDPTGITSYGYQEVGVPLMKARHNEMVFSPDGGLLTQANPADDLRLWDFDRCTGLLSNPRHYPHLDTADLSTGIISGGLAISQDGRYLYRGNNYIAYQYDLLASDIGASRTIVGLRDTNSLMVLGGIMELAPDGRIYIKPANGTARTMHVITHPERPTAQCGFETDYYYFERGYAAMPMFPNYRLGPLDGSACDTLGMNNYPLAGFRHDRLAGLLVDFTSVSWYEPDTWHWNFGDPASGGSNTSSEMHPDHVFSVPGLYPVCLTVSNQYGADTLCKQVYIDESVDVNEPQLTETEQGVLVYPNPASTWVECVFPQEVKGELRLQNMTGQVVSASSIAVTGDRVRMDVSALPAGVYVWSLQAQDGQVWSGKVVVVR